MPRPPEGGVLCIDGRRLSVRLCVCPVQCLALNREWKGAGSWTFPGRKPRVQGCQDKGDTYGRDTI